MPKKRAVKKTRSHSKKHTSKKSKPVKVESKETSSDVHIPLKDEQYPKVVHLFVQSTPCGNLRINLGVRNVHDLIPEYTIEIVYHQHEHSEKQKK